MLPADPIGTLMGQPWQYDYSYYSLFSICSRPRAGKTPDIDNPSKNIDSIVTAYLNIGRVKGISENEVLEKIAEMDEDLINDEHGFNQLHLNLHTDEQQESD